jgi:hypothetical protein
MVSCLCAGSWPLLLRLAQVVGCCCWCGKSCRRLEIEGRLGCGAVGPLEQRADWMPSISTNIRSTQSSPCLSCCQEQCCQDGICVMSAITGCCDCHPIAHCVTGRALNGVRAIMLSIHGHDMLRCLLCYLGTTRAGEGTHNSLKCRELAT